MDPVNVPAKFGWSRNRDVETETTSLPEVYPIVRKTGARKLSRFMARVSGACFTRSWDKGVWSFWGLRTPVLRKSGRRGSGMIGLPFEKALVSSYRPSIVTFPLSLRVSEILPLLCSHAAHHFSLPYLSSKFPDVPLGVDGWRLGYEEQRWLQGAGLIVRAISFQAFLHVIMIHQRHRRTDRQTDRRTDRQHALAIPRFAQSIIGLIRFKITNNKTFETGCLSKKKFKETCQRINSISIKILLFVTTLRHSLLEIV